MVNRTIVSVLALAAAATLGAFQPPSISQPPIVKVERLDNAAVRVTFDLEGASDSTFAIVLEASNDGGQSFAIVPRAVTGDVGANVRGGAGRSILWDTAKDIED